MKKEIAPTGATSLTATATTFGSQHNFPSGANGLQYKDSNKSQYIKELCNNIAVKQILLDSESKVEVERVDENTILFEIDGRFLNPDKELPKTKTWAKIGDRPAFTCNGIILINAKPKQGKSYSVYAILAALIRGIKFDSLQPQAIPSRCIVFDTEIAEIDLQTRIRPLYKIIGDENRAKFQVCSLLAIPKAKRLNVIMEIVEQYNPPIIAIDQIADLMDDFNSSVEAVALFERLKVLMAERTAFIVIHQNKSKDDTNSKGHAGTLAEQNCSELYTIKKDKGIFELSLKMARFASADDATPFRFALTEEGEIISCDDILRNNATILKEGLQRNFEHLFGVDDEVQYCDLVNRIVEVEGLQERAAKTKIKSAYECGSIIKDKKGRNVYYRLAPF